MGPDSIRGHCSTGGPLWSTFGIHSALQFAFTLIFIWDGRGMLVVFQVIRRAHVMSKVLDGAGEIEDGEKRRKLRAFATEMSSLCDSDLIKMVKAIII